MTDTDVMKSVRPTSDAGDAAATWRACFHDWPAGIPQSGVVVTTFDEQIPFSGFLVREDAVFLERRAPDSVGARAVMLPYANISALKIVDVFDKRHLKELGLRPVAR